MKRNSRCLFRKLLGKWEQKAIESFEAPCQRLQEEMLRQEQVRQNTAAREAHDQDTARKANQEDIQKLLGKWEQKAIESFEAPCQRLQEEMRRQGQVHQAATTGQAKDLAERYGDIQNHLNQQEQVQQDTASKYELSVSAAVRELIQHMKNTEDARTNRRKEEIDWLDGLFSEVHADFAALVTLMNQTGEMLTRTVKGTAEQQQQALENTTIDVAEETRKALSQDIDNNGESTQQALEKRIEDTANQRSQELELIMRNGARDILRAIGELKRGIATVAASVRISNTVPSKRPADVLASDSTPSKRHQPARRVRFDLPDDINADDSFTAQQQQQQQRAPLERQGTPTDDNSTAQQEQQLVSFDLSDDSDNTPADDDSTGQQEQQQLVSIDISDDSDSTSTDDDSIAQQQQQRVSFEGGNISKETLLPLPASNNPGNSFSSSSPVSSSNTLLEDAPSLPSGMNPPPASVLTIWRQLELIGVWTDESKKKLLAYLTQFGTKANPLYVPEAAFDHCAQSSTSICYKTYTQKKKPSLGIDGTACRTCLADDLCLHVSASTTGKRWALKIRPRTM
ncbi:MAG: hypothetical protein LQ341_006645 [Variospora aurantia]|nr:MAG: hypothetical protein LQ341_006645 [Variospora aurantia]